jgi:SAM-dependent methyltransferase
MDSAQAYRTMVVATDEQRLRRQPPATSNRWDSAAARFRDDPRRTPDENLLAIASFIRPDDVVLDVGGGAGRYALPLALRCREVVNIEPSPGMGSEFEASAKEAGIENARLVKADWHDAPEVRGDVSLVSHVTYFVADIVPFLEKLIAASRRRVIIGVSSTPPPNQGADLSEVLNGEPQAPVPGHRELLPVLWDMGILPEIRVVGTGQSTLASRVYATRVEAIDSQLGEREGAERESARKALKDSFSRLFREAPGGFRRNMGDARFMLITWETG